MKGSGKDDERWKTRRMIKTKKNDNYNMIIENEREWKILWKMKMNPQKKETN